jgi:hypothetical protein
MYYIIFVVSLLLFKIVHMSDKNKVVIKDLSLDVIKEKTDEIMNMCSHLVISVKDSSSSGSNSCDDENVTEEKKNKKLKKKNWH